MTYFYYILVTIYNYKIYFSYCLWFSHKQNLATGSHTSSHSTKLHTSMNKYIQYGVVKCGKVMPPVTYLHRFGTTWLLS